MKRLVLLFGIFSFSLGYAGELPKDILSEPLNDFSGGLDTTHPSHKISNSFSPFMRNVFIDNGKIETVNGYTVLGTTATLSKVTGIFPFVKEDGTTKFLVTDSSITLETADYSAWTLVSSMTNTATLLTWMQVRNKMWGFNGVDAVMTWDGTTRVNLNGNLSPAAVSTPNVPKFRYGAYDQNRVFGFNISGAASDLVFASVITTDSVIIAPDDSRAWPSINTLHVGQGDGSIGTALFVYNGQLRAGKEYSIHTIYGDSPTTYLPRKEELQDGIASNDSVVIMDGAFHDVGKNGIYKNGQRISDLIKPDFEAINVKTSNIVQNTWETQGDFQTKGSQYYGSSATSSGFLTMDTLIPANRVDFGGSVVPIAIVEDPTADPPPLTNSTSFYGPYHFTFDTTVDNYSNLYMRNFAWATANAGPCNVVFASVTIKNERTGIEEKSVAGVDVPLSLLRGNFSTTSAISPLFDGTDLLISSMSFKVEGCGFDLANLVDNGIMHLIPATTAQYTSQVTTESSIAAWGNFDSVRNTNSGGISYYFRSSTSVINITTQTWTSVSPGSVINAPLINNFVQWATTMTSVSTFTSIPQIDNVTINYITGSAGVARPFAINWKNRYWLSVSTVSDTTQRLLYVKSRSTNANPDAWMPIDGIPVCAFAQNQGIFYGGLCSAGSVLRMDYGTNYNGTTIVPIYETPDMAMGNPYFDKYMQNIFIEGKKVAGGVMNVGRVLNEAAVVYSTFSISGTGRYSRVINNAIDSGKTIRLRLMNTQKDVGMEVNSLSVVYTKSAIFTNK